MTIRGLLMASMMSFVLGGCSVSFMGTPNSAAPGNYGYGYAGKPISSVDHGQADDRGKPLHHGSAQAANDHDSPPAAKPTAPQRDEPARVPHRTKPAPHRTKPAQPSDTRPDSTDTPTRPGSTDKPPTRKPVDPPSTKPDAPEHKAHLVPSDQLPHVQPKPAPKQPAPKKPAPKKPAPKDDGSAVLVAHRVALHRASTR